MDNKQTSIDSVTNMSKESQKQLKDIMRNMEKLRAIYKDQLTNVQSEQFLKEFEDALAEINALTSESADGAITQTVNELEDIERIIEETNNK